jgi:hypothetical protein
MKIHPVGAELFNADGRTDMTKLIVAFLNDASTPKDANTIVQCGYKTRVDFQNGISSNTVRTFYLLLRVIRVILVQNQHF